MTGVVVEDRGPIGVHGRRLIQISVPMDPFEPATIEVPEEELEAVSEPAAAAAATVKTKAVEYLKNGGLIAILRSNTGGPHQPRVWLCLDNLGNVTHTFSPERGLIGGEVVPFWTVHDDKIFEPKRDEVARYLSTFGLGERDIGEVILAVGTHP